VEGCREWTERLNRAPHESIKHFFWECPITRRVVNGFGNRISGTHGLVFKKSEWLGGLQDYSVKNMQMSILVVQYVRYYLYNSRCRHKQPTIPQILYEFEGLVRLMRIGGKWSEQVEDIPILVARMME
jgi:hypothetical protein